MCLLLVDTPEKSRVNRRIDYRDINLIKQGYSYIPKLTVTLTFIILIF